MLKEQELIDKIEQELPRIFPSTLRVGPVKNLSKTASKDTRADIIVSARSPFGLKPIKLAIEVKSTPRLSTMLMAAHQVKNYSKSLNAYPVVASNFLGERVREALKEAEVGYIDLAGNFYLNLPNAYAERIVDKNPFSSTPPLKNIFAPVSSRITRALLTKPKKAWNLSDLSKETGVSIGQTYNVLEAMAAEKLARKNNDGKWIVEDPTALLDAWKEFYPTYQNRKYTFFSYRPYPNFELVSTTAKFAKLPYALGFFSGADKAAPFIRGLSKVQFYTDEEYIDKWREALDLKEVQSGGNIEIYVPYDKGVYYGLQELSVDGRYTRVVSNIQLYLDLFNNPARGEEAAEYLRKEKIGF